MLTSLRKFTRSRPGLDYRNYVTSNRDSEGCKAYMRESREITQLLHHARTLINAVEFRRCEIGAEQIVNAARTAFSGRLSYNNDRKAWDYCTGSYYPVEYRKAVCAVMTMCLIQHWFREGFSVPQMHSKAVCEFGKQIAGRWFK